MSSSLLIAAAAFLSVGLVCYAALDWVLSDDRKVRSVLANLSAYEAVQAAEAEPTLRPLRERLLKPVGARVAQMARMLWPPDYRQRVRRRIQCAGRPGGIDEALFLTVKALAPLAAAVLLVPLAVFCFMVGWRLPAVAALVLVPASFWVPDWWLSARVRARASRIRRALPDMLDMLTISVEAGLGFDAALAKLVQNTAGPLADEFDQMLREVQAGLSRREALRNLGERAQVPELASFITSMTHADVFGVSVSSVLRTQAADMRLRRRQAAEEQAQKATVKLVFPVIVCILPATLLVVVGPAAMSIGPAFGIW